ncbi:DUF4168 domain-containing protein [Thioalkalivibrio sulfidiphilus]|uniref:DUF4168 domain-containing protein n=1 Tax=Thioalkalivibrio sulfidiphilus (strain HL-EbGR7) TaxID=396588 RepID=B8GSU2_THISH|nr:DUF4168 domain-containing protein [Thioalkalivibrio sulfidiphilus]ACL71127.1 conserved hypothetical protein [Thioalkalivibrio sulfidiphilus HL-EbGr7]
MPMTFRKLPLAIALAAAFGFSAAAHAQGQPQQGDPSYGAQPPAGMEQQGAQIDPQTLDRFVDAFVAVQEIRQDFSERLQGVENEAEAQAMQQEAQEEMISAVEDKGLNVEEYNQVAMALQSDPAMMQRVQQMAEERM